MLTLTKGILAQRTGFILYPPLKPRIGGKDYQGEACEKPSSSSGSSHAPLYWLSRNLFPK